MLELIYLKSYCVYVLAAFLTAFLPMTVYAYWVYSMYCASGSSSHD